MWHLQIYITRCRQSPTLAFDSLCRQMWRPKPRGAHSVSLQQLQTDILYLPSAPDFIEVLSNLISFLLFALGTDENQASIW